MLEYRMGIDVGSTTVKLVIVDNDTKEMIYSCYERHNARQAETVYRLIKEAKKIYPDILFKLAVCGSGGKPIASRLKVKFIQEVVANSSAVCYLYPNARTAIELGGQDAKVVFFYYDEDNKKLEASDMRMNGSCAGGTGAFIDEISALLNTPTEKFESLACKGTTVYDISGRCGVFAKTDIQPLLISGAAIEDIALSTFHAIAKQTIGGLSQGLELKAPIIFEGGPLTFNKTLVKVFAERLNLKDEDIIIPTHPETIVAFGTAIAIDSLDNDNEKATLLNFDNLIDLLEKSNELEHDSIKSKPLFLSEEDRIAFAKRHDASIKEIETPNPIDNNLDIYIGIDSGSTTSKFVFLDKDERVIDKFYANNHGDPINVVKNGLLEIIDKYDKQGIKLNVLGLGTTGYGEQLFAKAFKADYHTVETVAHSKGCMKYFPDATFLLDIGGQDMKAIWLDHGVITNIMLNEACSSGCGSFLENFATNLDISVDNIEKTAFLSKDPAHLGSRCTVFMNSTIINEQRNGKNPDDIMAGLCRSIIENVFTKVVRVTNVSSLGNKVVVQGGTFRNHAVLRALEEYIGHDVNLAPYPGEMGALGAALYCKHKIEENGYLNHKSSSFIGLDAIKDFSYTKETGVKCPICSNHCSRTIMRFNNGDKWITGNRCDKGAIDTLDSKELIKYVKSLDDTNEAIPNMFTEREKLLFKEYDYTLVREKQNITIGLPKVLEFYDSMPFWSTFFHALGYDIKMSNSSSRKMYESGMQYVTSDTICFPAKLVHGHILDLANQHVDKIFMPYVMHMPPEGVDKNSPYVCSIIMGYPMVVRNSQDPYKKYGIPFETPIFHWYKVKNKEESVVDYAIKSLNASKKEAKEAFLQAQTILDSFRTNLREMAVKIIDETTKNKSFAVVLAGRPYHTDPFINHNLAKMFTKKGIPVLTVDSLPGLNEVDLSHTRCEITNDFHTRMLAGAFVSSKIECLEYVQIVSFGCGHDAILSDEIVRIMTESGKKPPLILKVDESDATGALGIRTQSFIETVEIRRKTNMVNGMPKNKYTPLGESSPAKFFKKDKKIRTVLLPNVNEEAAVLLAAIFEKEGFIVKTIPIGSSEQINLGKKYVHNDICFPSQMVIGELIYALQQGNYDQDTIAVGMLKFQCDCRMSHYSGLLRKGLDAAGFKNVPILTTDMLDTKDNHPGVFIFGISSVLEAIWAFMMLDSLKYIVRKIRPYEINKGETNKVFKACVDKLAVGIKKSLHQAKKSFKECINDLMQIKYDRTNLKKRVFVTGEILVTFHPGTNFHLEDYLENNGIEAMFPRITDQLRKDFNAMSVQIKEFDANIPPYPFLVAFIFDRVQKSLDDIAIKHPLYDRSVSPVTMYQGVKEIIPQTLSCGEGWLMCAEIDHLAREGVKAFVILQPFGCLPNHICGRGVIKKLKEKYPSISILPLDLDPDTSFANIENRLQMLLMNKD